MSSLLALALVTLSLDVQDPADELVLRSYETAHLTRAVRKSRYGSFGVHVPSPGGFDTGEDDGSPDLDILAPDVLADYLRACVPGDDLDREETFLEVRDTCTVVLAPRVVQTSIERALDDLNAALRRATHEVVLRWYVGEGTRAIATGVCAAQELTLRRQQLDERAELVWSTQFEASPWDEHVADELVMRRVLLDVDVEVTPRGPLFDPVCLDVPTGIKARLRQLPLESGNRVLLHVDFDRSRLAELRTLQVRLGEGATMPLELPDIEFAAFCQRFPVAIGGGVILALGEGAEAGVLFVSVGRRPSGPTRRTRAVPFLHTQTLREPHSFPTGLPYRWWWDAGVPREPGPPPLTDVEIAAIFTALGAAYPTLEGRAWVPLMNLEPAAAARLRTSWKAIEQDVLRGAHLEVLEIESAEESPPSEVEGHAILARQTLLVQEGATSRCAVGRETSRLADWDPEVAYEGKLAHAVSDPIEESEFTGTWIHLRPYDVAADRVSFHLELREHRRVGEPREVEPSRVIGPLELSCLEQAVFQRELTLKPGEIVCVGTVRGATGSFRHAFVTVREVMP
ncbi:MAG: hypothetical protein H6834_09320 [Planctomycetes bacterium]|nr:hypothetical protein [Planctomycetota bacterium]